MTTPRLAATAALATALAAALLLTSCGTAPEDVRGRGAGTWSELPAAPVTPRTGAVAAWTGTEALFLGGDTGDLCPPNADCAAPATSARDGAAFDPAAGSWRPTADAPQPIPGRTPVTVSGDTAHLLLEDRLLSYDASEDAWSVSPGIPHDAWWGGLAATDDGDVVVAIGERQDGAPPDQVYDPEERTWSDLPADPLGASFDRGVTAVPGALVLTGAAWVPDPGSAEPSVLRGAVLDLGTGAWRLLEDSDQLGGAWAWTGTRLVSPVPGSEDGGETNGWGRSVPYAGALDPFDGTWHRLDGVPDAASGGWPVQALGGRVSAFGGWIYHDGDGSWTRLPRPQRAPADPGSAVWAGDRLVVMGGLDSDAGWTDEQLTDRAWMWTPAAAPEVGGVVTDDDLAGSWVLVEGTSGGRPIGIPDQARGTLTFGPGSRMGGTAFCNGYGGRYELDGDVLHTDEVAQTLMACPGPVGEAEGAFLGVLLGAPLEVRLDGGRLVLGGEKGTLQFARLPEVPVEALVGVRWVLQSVTDAGGTSPAAGSATLEFGDGTARVSTGCREFDATWTAVGDSVHLADWEFAELDCPPQVAAQDEALVRLLGDGFQPTVEGDVLTLVDVAAVGAPMPTATYRAS